MKQIPVFPDILAAHERIRPFVHRTPVLSCAALDRLAGAELFFKAENLQKAGAFKFRGAVNVVEQLTPAELARGVATHSSGNHGQALALAARARGGKAFIVMPLDAPRAKRSAVEDYGGQVRLCPSSAEGRESALSEVLAETGAVYVPSYDDPRVIAGQGTAALELLKELPDLDALVAPLGGGGLLSGTAIAAHGLGPRLKIYGAEPELADDAYWSLQRGRLMGPKPARTLADGLRMALSELTFAILREHVEAVIRLAEGEILAAMKLLWERAKTVVEPSGAIGLAAVLREPDRFAGKRVGVLLSGGNVDLSEEKLGEYFRAATAAESKGG